MKHEIEWDVDTLSKFIKLGKLNKEQIQIMRLRTSDNTDREIADEVGISVATYYRRIVELKYIYDKIQAEFPNELPERKHLNEKQFRINTAEELMSFADNTNFDKYYIKMEFIRKKSRE